MQDMKNRRHDKQGGTMILSKTMLASLLAALPLASLSVHAEDAAAVKSEPLRILTYNIYGDWRAPKWGVPPRAAGVERAIVKAKPDVVALQEVIADWWESPLFKNLSAAYGMSAETSPRTHSASSGMPSPAFSVSAKSSA